MNKTTLKTFYKAIVRILFPSVRATMGTHAPITFRGWFFQKILGFNRAAYWPTHFTSRINGARNILVGVGSAPGLSPGCYIQGRGSVYIGDHVLIAPNVGIISANHDLYDHSAHLPGIVRIGDYSWIGMGCIVLPNVTLGDFTVVAAGSVVTQSFEEGYCILGGSPARIIKKLDPSQCVRYGHASSAYYHGYIPASKFDSYRKKHLTI